jgi:predicted dehydrogenase
VKAVTASALTPLRAGVDQPECVVVSAEYPEGFLGVFTVNYAAMKYQSRNDQLNQADGDKARLDIGRESFRVLPAGDEEKPILERKSARGFGWATDLHVQNFLECVRTRQRPTAPMALGAQAALVVQLANRSLREGRRIENTTF